jgi:hypothetical protein
MGFSVLKRCQSFRRLWLWVVVGATPAALLALTLLLYLWRPNNFGPETLWFRIVHGGWVTQTITLCSTVIRASVTSQMGVCCWMMASISLVHKQVLFKDGAMMSVARFASSGPFDIFLPLFRATKARRGGGSSGFLIVTVLALMSIVFQFTSTILTSDLALQSIPGQSRIKNVTYARYDSSGPVYGWRLIARNPTEYPIFAEQAAKFNSIKVPGEGGLGDTGNKLQALLPLSKSDRASILSYDGPANIIASHVLCVSPSIDNFNASYRGEGDNFATIEGQLSTPFLARDSGNLHFGNSFEGLRNFAGLNFSCNIPMHFDKTLSASSRPVYYTICSFTPPGTLLANTDQYSNDSSEPFPPKNILSNFNDWILVTNNSIGKAADWNNATFASKPKPVFDGSEWASLSDDTNTVAVGLSLCIHTFRRTQNRLIRAQGGWNHTEPEVVDNNSEFYEQPFDTTQIRRMHGVSNKHSFTIAERGILNLTQLGETLGYFKYEAAQTLETLVFEEKANSISMCNNCNDGIRVFHPILSALFIDTVSDTGSAAQALQVLMATMTTMYYYDRKLFFNIEKEAKIQYLSDISIPHRMQGLSVVIGILVLHFLLMLFITFMFLQDERNSVGEAWMTISQLHLGGAREFLSKASNLDDKAVNKMVLKERLLEGWSDGIAEISPAETGTALNLTIIPQEGLRERLLGSRCVLNL